MCGVNARGAQRHDGIFILQYTSLKMAILLHKTALVNFPMATTLYAYLEAYVYHFCQFLQGLRLFEGLDLFETLD